MKRIVQLICFISVSLVVFLNLKNPYLIDKECRLQGISWQHWFGTDYLGRDLFSRVIYGCFYSLSIALLVLIGIVLISLLLGGSAGLIGGVIDSFITIVADMMISIPSMILALVFAGLFSNSIFTVMAALIISGSGKYIRYIRNLVLNIKTEEFVLLAPLRGSFTFHTLFYHILPNLVALFTTDLGKILISISGLSFLGIGIQPPTPELGTILFDGKAYFFVAPWVFIFPGILLSGIVILTQRISKKINQKWGVVYD